MTEHRIPRDGKAPLVFAGDQLARGDSMAPGRESLRWHELAVYRTEGGQWILEIRYRTLWQGEPDWLSAEALDSAESLRQLLERYDPRADVGGYPAIPAYAERRERQMADVERRFRAMVGEVLSRIPGIEERIA